LKLGHRSYAPYTFPIDGLRTQVEWQRAQVSTLKAHEHWLFFLH
jgi:hypothetical protein